MLAATTRGCRQLVQAYGDKLFLSGREEKSAVLSGSKYKGFDAADDKNSIVLKDCVEKRDYCVETLTRRNHYAFHVSSCISRFSPATIGLNQLTTPPVIVKIQSI